MARKWEIEKMKVEKFIQQMEKYGEVINTLHNIFGEDSKIEECNDPYLYLRFTVEQGEKQVLIKTIYVFEIGIINVEITVIATNGNSWRSNNRFIPSHYDEFIENKSFETYLRELTTKFVDNGILSWGKEND